MIRANYVAALAAAAAVFGFAASASAGPASSQAAGNALATTSALAQEVDYRGGRRHCHWRGGERHCHGGYGNRYDGPRYGSRYGYRPGIYLRFGSGRDYDRRRRWR
jgi:hypothetical protein